MHGNTVNRRYHYDGDALTGWAAEQWEGSPEEFTLVYDEHGQLEREQNNSQSDVSLHWSPRTFQWDDAGQLIHGLAGSMGYGFDDAYHYDETGKLESIEQTWRDSGRVRGRTKFLYEGDDLKYVEVDSDADGLIDSRTTFSRENGRLYHYEIESLTSDVRSSYYLQYDDEGRVVKRESEFTGSGYHTDMPRYDNQYGAMITQFGTFSYGGCSAE
jgi:hypothetical protein